MIKKFLFSTTQEQSLSNEMTLTLLRVFFGSCFIVHGMAKIPISDQLIEGMSALGLPFPVFFAWLVALTEVIGGGMLILGFMTRVASLGLAITMFVAGFIVHGKDPFQVKELAFVFLVISLVFLSRGAGKYSIDRFFRN